MWIVLFSKFTSVEDNVSTILSPLKVDSEAPLFLFFLFVGRKKILVQCEGRLPSTLDTQFSSCYKSSSFSAQGKKNPFFIKMFDKIYK